MPEDICPISLPHVNLNLLEFASSYAHKPSEYDSQNQYYDKPEWKSHSDTPQFTTFGQISAAVERHCFCKQILQIAYRWTWFDLACAEIPQEVSSMTNPGAVDFYMTQFPEHSDQRGRQRAAWAICFRLGCSSTKDAHIYA